MVTKRVDEKNAVKVRNWVMRHNNETGLLCEILMDPMNGFLKAFEFKA